MKHYIAFDIGGTKIKHCIIQEDGTILSKSDYPSERRNLDVFVNDLLRTIRDYQSKYEVSGIAISMPGYIDYRTGYSEMAGAIEALNGKNLKAILQEHINLPIEIENDGNCAAIAEHATGHAQGCENFICMTIGTGIGGGIFLNGKIFHGYQFKGGEFGFMVTQMENGLPNMHEIASTTSLLNAYKTYKNVDEVLDGRIIFEELKTDEQVQKIFQQWVSHLCRGIYNLVVTLNPEKFLIGGGVSAQPVLFEEINRQMQNYLKWEEFKIPILPCKHRNDAGMIGAFYHFKHMQQN